MDPRSCPFALLSDTLVVCNVGSHNRYHTYFGITWEPAPVSINRFGLNLLPNFHLVSITFCSRPLSCY